MSKDKREGNESPELAREAVAVIAYIAAAMDPERSALAAHILNIALREKQRIAGVQP